MYVFSSQNQKDYFNLMSVYLDAVLHPKLDEFDFMFVSIRFVFFFQKEKRSICFFSFRQEGWRLEHEKTNDPTSPIVIKGVVYNEMKGVFVSFSSTMFDRSFAFYFSE